jgi:hypothetical protein
VGPATYTPNPRGPTSIAELAIDWEYPVHRAKVDGPADRTQSRAARRALSAEAAHAEIAGTDRRPLLVLRECLSCNGTDDALLTRAADNERTMLMSRWFHCIKLPPDVTAEDHPFHALFAGEKPGHLFVARWDGSGRVDLDGQQSRAELWKLMEGLLACEYEGKATEALRRLFHVLDDFDAIDAEIRAVKGEIDEVLEDSSASPSKLEKLRGKLAGLDREKAEATARALELSELKLKVAQDSAPPASSPKKT